VSADRCLNGFCVERAGQNKPCSSSDDCGSAAPYCDAYAGNICTIGLTFATGALDCQGYQPNGTGGGADSGPLADGTANVDAASGD